MSGSAPLLAAIDVHPAISLPIAAMLAGAILWHWRRLPSSPMPPTQRRLRRYSLMLSLLLLPGLVVSASFIDHREAPWAYVAGWMAVMLLLGVLVLVAMVELLVAMHEQRRGERRLIGSLGGRRPPVAPEASKPPAEDAA
jgi:hypothetical protein